VSSNVSCSPSQRQPGATLINIQSTRRTAFDFCKNASLSVLFDSNGNSCTVYTQSDVCVCACACLRVSIYRHILHNIDTAIGQRNNKIGTAVNAAYPGALSTCHFGHSCHRFFNRGLVTYFTILCR
jgi:hypothetical protein